MKVQTVIVSATLFLQSPDCPGQSALALDHRFKPVFTLSSSWVSSALLLPDGKILVGGDFSVVGNVPRTGLARLNPDGTLDPSFNFRAQVPGDWSVPVGRQPDGRIVISGRFGPVERGSYPALARLLPDGSLDASFHSVRVSETSGGFQALTVTPDGSVLVGGFFSAIDGVARGGIARLNSDGELDHDFARGAGAWRPDCCAGVRAIAVLSNGQILIGGAFSSYNGVARQDLARLNPDGSLDTSFTSSLPPYTLWFLAVDSDGKVLIGGQGLYRLEADGTRDPSFKPKLIRPDGWEGSVYGMALDALGRIVVHGDFVEVNDRPAPYYARVLRDGSLDASFQSALPKPPSFGHRTLVTQPDGKVLLPAEGLVRLENDGRIDEEFTPELWASGHVNGMAAGPDGKLVVVGGFSRVNGVPRGGVARFDADGSLDAAFVVAASPGFLNSPPQFVAVQSDGKIVVAAAGPYTSRSIPRPPEAIVQRFNADGSLDPGFNAVLKVDPEVTDLSAFALQSDGKVLFAIRGSGPQRLNADGTLDTSFNPDLGPGVFVSSMAFAPDGRILAAGVEPWRRFMVRIHPDGSLDPAFNIELSFSPNALAVEVTGTILIAGVDDLMPPPSAARVVRSHPDGRLDTIFENRGVGAIDQIAASADGTIQVGQWDHPGRSYRVLMLGAKPVGSTKSKHRSI